MKLIQSYKQQRITDRYDVIVIGSGLGGMSVAAILAKEGKKVLVRLSENSARNEDKRCTSG
jgi:2-polyprenyl-6-methoxyphenol hydroxylase-like FAD-dependent oxidoreductase